MLNYENIGDVAVIKIDDGKANAIGHNFVDAVNDSLDCARENAKSVLLLGRTGIFSAGFDLKELAKGDAEKLALVAKGANLLLRIFQHPQPVVAACEGHAIAGGALLLLAADTRIGIDGDYKIGLNETAIGRALPTFGTQLSIARLSPSFQTKAVIQGQMLNPTEAKAAGFLDQTTNVDDLYQVALNQATELATLPADAYTTNKLAMRQPYIQAIKASLSN